MPYGSARHLPTFIEMQQQLKGLRLLGLLLPKKDRQLLKDLAAQLDHLAGVVDSFYDCWAHATGSSTTTSNVDDMATLVATHANNPEGAEQAFIAWYQAEDHLPFIVRRLHAHEGLRARMHLPELALEDYRAGRYYAVVQVPISVMDGFVNDLTPANRRGLHAREAEDLDAWNSVVGHHQGLTSAHKSYTKCIKARNDQPVFELYRHGIVHGIAHQLQQRHRGHQGVEPSVRGGDWARAMDNERRQAAKPRPHLA